MTMILAYNGFMRIKNWNSANIIQKHGSVLITKIHYGHLKFVTMALH